MRREPLLWLIAFGVLIGAFFVSVAVLNSTVYSANGFVRSYLAALESRDSTAALDALRGEAASGVPKNGGSDALLTDTAMGKIGNIALVRDTPGAGGIHTVVFDYSFGSTGDTHRTEFRVVQEGTRFGLFSRWAFVASPLSTVSITASNVDSFTVNGHTVASAPDAPTTFLAFAPGNYTLAHNSTYLSAPALSVAVTSTGTIIDAAIDPEPTTALIDWTTDATAAFLDACAKQTVLMPTGCPFGETISNRITSTPQWSITDYPAVEITREPTQGSWVTGPAPGVAHLKVSVQSLFDGTLSLFDEDVAFASQFAITFDDGQPSLRFID
ncbi:MAG: hypothetical protein ACOH1T_09780 [Microbacteriaceae bacterium]